MSIETYMKAFKQIQLVPTIFLTLALYLFSIDFITAVLLGYEPKDYLSLIDIEKVVFSTTTAMMLLVLIGIIIKKSLLASMVSIIIFTAIYALYVGIDIEKTFETVVTMFFLLAALSYNIYDEYIRPFLDEPLKYVVVNGFTSMLVSFFLIGLVNNNLSSWNSVVKVNDKLEIVKDKTPRLLLNAKSFNPAFLRPLAQSEKVYMYPELANAISVQIYNKTLPKEQNFLILQHDHYQTEDAIITSNYYDNDDVKNIFFMNPNSCKNNKCELHTFIIQQVHKSDSSKGYKLISHYVNDVDLIK